MLPFHPLIGAKGGINTADPGHVLFTTPGTVSWTVPEGVWEVSAATIGSGAYGINGGGFTAAGDGADLRWVNNLPVRPGEVLNITIADVASSANPGCGLSKIERGGSALLQANGTGGSGRVSTPFGTDTITKATVGGGNGGARGGSFDQARTVGGGGAGGYSGNGGDGNTYANGQNFAPTNGQGGAGAGGIISSPGGGVGILGEGASGVANGAANGSQRTGSGIYGGGAGTSNNGSVNVGQQGAVRLLWGKGVNNGGRAFPATNVFSATA